jgi:hypothetical protein
LEQEKEKGTDAVAETPETIIALKAHVKLSPV